MRSEPVMIGAVVNAAVALGTAFGLALTAEQVAGIVTVVSFVVGLVARARVSPTASQ